MDWTPSGAAATTTTTGVAAEPVGLAASPLCAGNTDHGASRRAGKRPLPLPPTPPAATLQDILWGVSAELERRLLAQSTMFMRSGLPTVFDGAPLIRDTRVYALLELIANEGLCSKECFIVALLYTERLARAQPSFCITRRNMQRLVLAAVLVGSKVIDDFYCRNMYYAVSSGLNKAELNHLELKLCGMLDWKLHVEPDEFEHYLNRVLQPAQEQQRPPVHSVFRTTMPAPGEEGLSPFAQQANASSPMASVDGVGLPAKVLTLREAHASSSSSSGVGGAVTTCYADSCSGDVASAVSQWRTPSLVACGGDLGGGLSAATGVL